MRTLIIVEPEKRKTNNINFSAPKKEVNIEPVKRYVSEGLGKFEKYNNKKTKSYI